MSDEEIKTEQETDENPERKRKKITPGSVLCTLFILIGVGMIGFSAYKLIGISLAYHKANAEYEDLEQFYVTVNPNKKPNSSENGSGGGPNRDEIEDCEWYEEISVNLTDLKEMNRDVAGWIYFEGMPLDMQISYPVMYSGDNTAYLRTGPNKRYSINGSIFIEAWNHPDLEDSHTVIYGHNMDNMAMFGPLRYYRTNGYYEDHKMFQIFVDGKVYRYQIFAYEIVEETSEVYTVPFSASDDFGEFIDMLYGLSMKKTGVEVTKDDKVLTLSTCCNKDGYRFVVHAVRVEEHEVDTSGKA